jgi:type II secretion system (T2SS) protein E
MDGLLQAPPGDRSLLGRRNRKGAGPAGRILSETPARHRIGEKRTIVATRRIGELLVAEGLLSEAAVQRALGYQRQAGDRMKLGSILVNWYLLPEASLLSALAKLHGCRGVSWSELGAASPDIVRLLPAAHAIRLSAIPYAAENGFLRVAFVNPSNLAAIDEVAALTGRSVQPGVATEARILQAQRRFLGRLVPLEYRQILQKFDRPPAAALPPVERDFHTSQVVEIEGAAPPARPAKSASPGPALPRVELPFFPEIRRISDLDAAASRPGGRRSTAEGPADDSLADWVGGSISAFRGDLSPESPVAEAPADDMPATIPPFRRANDPIDLATARIAFPFDAGARAPVRREAPEIETPPEEISELTGREARTRDEVADSVLRDSLSGIPRVLLLGSGKSGVTGWRGRGAGLSIDNIAAIRIPTSATSVFSSVRRTGVPHFGSLDGLEWPKGLADLFGTTPPACAVFPIRVLEGVAGFLYADRLGEPMRYEDFAAVARSAAQASKLFARFLRPDLSPARS